MADRLTQLQDCLDQLATQFFASIRYLTSHHAKPPPPPAPSSNNPAPPPTTTTTTTTVPGTNPATTITTAPAGGPTTPPPPQDTISQEIPEVPKTPPPDSPSTFAAAQRELASDLLLKVAQIEYLIGVLPGVETSAQEQEERIRELEGERGVEDERGRAIAELEGWRERVEGVIGGVSWGRG